MGLQVDYLDSEDRATGPNAQDPSEFRFTLEGIALVWRRDFENVERFRLHIATRSGSEAHLGPITVRRLSRDVTLEASRPTAAWSIVVADLESRFEFHGQIEGMRGDAFRVALEIAMAGEIL